MLNKIQDWGFGQQHDPRAYLRLLFQLTETENQSNDWCPTLPCSVLQKTFEVILYIETTCSNCNHTHGDFQHVFEIIVSPTNSNLQQAINNLSKPTNIPDYLCNVCHQRCAVSQTKTIFDIFDSLIVTIKRNSDDPNDNSKIDNAIDIPKLLKLGDNSLDLYSVIEHKGIDSTSGHFVNYIKTDNNIWLKCDDCTVTQQHPQLHITRNTYVAFYKVSKTRYKWQRAPKKLKHPSINKFKSSRFKLKQRHSKPTNTSNKCNNNTSSNCRKRIANINPNKNINRVTKRTSKKASYHHSNKLTSNRYSQKTIKLAFSTHKCMCHESNAGYFWRLKRKLPKNNKYTSNINRNMKLFLSIISKQFLTCKIIPKIKISCNNTDILIHACNSKSKHLIWQSCMIFIDLKKNRASPKSELWIYERYNLKDDKTLCFKNVNNGKRAYVILYGVLQHEIQDIILPFSESLDCRLINNTTYYKHKNLDKYAIAWISNKQAKLYSFIKGLIKRLQAQ